MSDDRVPPGTGRARDLVGKRRPTQLPDTGRRHHLGAVPPEMPVLGPDGHAGATRTNAVQLASLQPAELRRLGAAIDAEMAAAVESLAFERAAALRDERAALDGELARRATRE
jgi:hypothetical protein